MDNASKRNQFEKMSLSDLKEYLKARGVSVAGYLKPALVEIAKCVQKMMIPVLDYKKSKEEGEKIIVHGIEIEDPLSPAHKYVNDFNASPPFGLFDIFNHLIYSSTEYDKQGLAAYKAFDDYRLFEEGYVESLLTKPLPSVGVHLFVGKVRPSMKKSDDQGKAFYDVWFILEAKGASRGSVLRAKCTCKGGQDGGCKHVSAAMYSLEDLLNTRVQDSATSGPCQWVKRPTASSKPCKIKDLVIGKLNSPPLKKRTKAKDFSPKKKLLGKRSKVGKTKQTKKKRKDHTFCENIDVDVRSEDHRRDPSPESVRKFISSIKDNPDNSDKAPAILNLLEKMYLPEEEFYESTMKSATTWDSSLKSETSSVGGVMKEKLMQFSCKNDVVAALENEAKEMFTPEEICHVDAITVEQWKCPEWYMHKAGIISASKAKRVNDAQSSLKVCKDKDVSKLVGEIVDPYIPTCNRSLPDDPHDPRDWGLKHEETARRDYFKVQEKQHHKLKIESRGFTISSKEPYLGASVDNIRHCSCEKGCPTVVVEYKCPWSKRYLDPKQAFLSAAVCGEQEGEKFSLKKNSGYYYQVQIQMFAHELSLCDFVVWTTLGIFLVEVPFDKQFVISLVANLKDFWVNNVLSVLMPHTESQSVTQGEKCIDHPSKDSVAQESEDNCNNEDEVPLIFSDKESTINDILIQNENPLLSINVSGCTIYETCIEGLRPNRMVNDNIVKYLIGETCCIYPVVSSFWYTVLCGEQEGKNRKSREERHQKAEQFFPAELLEDDYIFIPINRRYHWLLAVITPWHVLLMDSLTCNATDRRNEFLIIKSYLEYMGQKYNLAQKLVEQKQLVMQVPQQHPSSNNCGIYVAKFLQHFLEDIQEYETNSSDYTAKIHSWFCHEDAEKKRKDTQIFLQNLFNIELYKAKYQ